MDTRIEINGETVFKDRLTLDQVNRLRTVIDLFRND